MGDGKIEGSFVVGWSSGTEVGFSADGTTHAGLLLSESTLFPPLCTVKPFVAALLLSQIVDDVGGVRWSSVKGCASPVSLLDLLAHDSGIAEVSSQLVRVADDGWRREVLGSLTVGGERMYTEYSGYAAATRAVELVCGSDFRLLSRSGGILSRPWDQADWVLTGSCVDVTVPYMEVGGYLVPILGEIAPVSLRGWNPSFGGLVSVRDLVEFGESLLSRGEALAPSVIRYLLEQRGERRWDPTLNRTMAFTAGFFLVGGSDWFGRTLTDQAVGICGAGGTSFLMVDPGLELVVAGFFELAVDEPMVNRRRDVIETVVADGGYL